MTDYLKNPDALPNDVRAILDKNEHTEDYPELSEMIAELEALGWTADYDLGGTVFDLRPMTEEEKAAHGNVEASPGIAASTIFELAQSAVSDMGDIFFEPQADFGEYSLPANIATNACSAAIEAALKQAGVTIDGTVTQLAESSNPDADQE